jgi:ABC-2 type transport system permease protein
MIRRIARKEMTEMFRDGRFRVLAAIVLAVSVVSMAAGWRHYADISSQHRTAQAATRDQWLRQPKKNPHSAAHYGVYAFKPKNPLAIVDTGIDPYVGVAVWLEAHKQNEFKYRPAQDRTAVQRFGEMTAAETLQVLVPLFIILMTFSAFAGEREQGTLRQVLSLGVSRQQLAVGKALGIAAALGLVLLPSTIAGVAALVLTSDGGGVVGAAGAAGGGNGSGSAFDAALDGVLAGDPMRALLLAATYLAYFAIVTALSLAVSARARSSRLALVILLTFWFANGLVASRAMSDLAASLYPTPSAVEFQRALERDLNEPAEMERRLERRKAELLKQYGVASVDALPIAFSGISLQEGEEHGNEVFDRHYGRLFEQYSRQNAVYQLGAIAAPMLAVRSLSMALSGTDYEQHRHFIGAAETYRRLIQRVMNDDIVSHQKKGETYLAGRELWEKVPDFGYDAPSTSWVMANQRASAIVLGVWVLASIAVMTYATRQMAVN